MYFECTSVGLFVFIPQLSKRITQVRQAGWLAQQVQFFIGVSGINPEEGGTMKRRLTKVIGSIALTGAFILSTGASSSLAQDRWDRWERRQEWRQRQAERMDRWREREEMRRIRELDRERQLRYQYRFGNRMVGYYDRFGQFHPVGYYDRFGNFWRYRY